MAFWDFAKRKQPSFPFMWNYSGAIPPERTTEGFLKAYGEIGWLFAVVSKIATGVSDVKWRLYSGEEREGKRKQIAQSPILKLLDFVNPYMTGAEFIELTQMYIDLVGECFWVMEYNKLGEPAEIWIPYPHRMSIVPSKKEFIKGYVYQVGIEKIPLEIKQVIHFKLPNPLNQYRGLGATQALAVDLNTEEFAAKWQEIFFYNSARPDGVIQFEKTLSEEQFDRLKKQWSEKYKGVSKAHQVALLDDGGKYVQVQNTIKDMDFRNLRLLNRDAILGAFGMPLSVMGISENVNRANAEAGEYTFARWIVKPRLDRIKNKLNEQLIPLFRKSENLELDYDEVVPETIEQKMNLAESGMRAGYLTIDEARQLRGLDKLPNGAGEVLLVPLNLIPTPTTKPAIKPTAGDMGQPAIGEGDAAENIAEGEKLNGIQIQAALEVLSRLIVGNIPAEVALELLVAVGIDRERAQDMIDSCQSFTPENLDLLISPPKSIQRGKRTPPPTKTPKGKTLTPDQKKLHWEVYAQKTARQEEVFKKVFTALFDEQKTQIIEQYKKTKELPPLDDEKTAQKFQPAIELVYNSAFEDAV